jgi:hypothetical protein
LGFRIQDLGFRIGVWDTGFCARDFENRIVGIQGALCEKVEDKEFSVFVFYFDVILLVHFRRFTFLSFVGAGVRSFMGDSGRSGSKAQL